MKKSLFAGLIALCVILSGCSALLLDREYVHISTHNTTPTAEGDPSTLRAESYQELVNALMYFINQGAETGSIRVYSDSEDVEADLDAACLEVVQEDPLGAYAVEYIKYSLNPIVTYHQADVQITYRRTREQMASIVSATGTTAIRSELETALASFAPERVLRIGYFDGDEDYIRTLCQEAYHANPATALDEPDSTISIYPDSGRQRIVEITLAYHLDLEELERRKELLALERQELIMGLWSSTGDELILSAAQAILDQGGYDPKGGDTAYHALLAEGANSEGLALAMALLCEELSVNCHIVSGTLGDRPHVWTIINTQAGWKHLDLVTLSDQETPFLSDELMEDAGYAWATGSVPKCS